MKIELNEKMLAALICLITILAAVMVGFGLAAASTWYAPGNINGGGFFNITNFTKITGTNVTDEAGAHMSGGYIYGNITTATGAVSKLSELTVDTDLEMDGHNVNGTIVKGYNVTEGQGSISGGQIYDFTHVNSTNLHGELTWTDLASYPSAAPSGSFYSTMGDTMTATSPSSYAYTWTQAQNFTGGTNLYNKNLTLEGDISEQCITFGGGGVICDNSTALLFYHD